MTVYWKNTFEVFAVQSASSAVQMKTHRACGFDYYLSEVTSIMLQKPDN